MIPQCLVLYLDCPYALTYLAARSERHQAEREFLATARGTLDAWSAAGYMEAAWQAESAAWQAARARHPGLPMGP